MFESNEKREGQVNDNSEKIKKLEEEISSLDGQIKYIEKSRLDWEVTSVDSLDDIEDPDLSMAERFTLIMSNEYDALVALKKAKEEHVSYLQRQAENNPKN